MLQFHGFLCVKLVVNSIKKEMKIIEMTNSQANFILPVSIATYTAVGAVWVFPGILPANMSVAPNSPNALAKLSMNPETIDFTDSGRVTCKKNIKITCPVHLRSLFDILVHGLKSSFYRLVH